MALATKCPHCNTIFRVAHDQLKLRGGIVRCGACNEVFDGNAALVDPTPKQPVIIDIPAASPTPATSPELDALISTLDTIHAAEEHGEPEAGPMAVAAPGFEPEPASGAEPAPASESRSESRSGLEPTPEPATNSMPEPEPRLDLPEPVAAAPEEEVFDLDLDVEPEPEDALSIGEERETVPEPLEDVLELDVEPDGDAALPEPEGAHSAWPYAPTHPSAPAEADHADHANAGADTDASTEATRDMDAAFDASPVPAYDGRVEPTLDIPDEHLTAVALHDSFELDAYPHLRDEQRDERRDAEDDGDARPPAIHDDEEDEDDAHVVTLSGGTALAAALDGADTDGADLGRDAADDAPAAADPTAAATPVSAGAPEEPGFVKRSRRRERFGKTGRVLMICAIPLLLAGIAAQVVGTFRNPLAAAVPALKPALVSACALAGCKVELPSQIDALSIEQGELQTMADNVFSFATSLRNQSASAQAWPHIELILNDGADKPVLRRVFAPREYLSSRAEVEQGFLPRSEQSVKLYFELAQVKASGYHIAVFYP
ncbi:DUF3426 domain-containing protein [Pseudoduganella namucuonensis]|uniref:MJ0042 family finger-like domain-containing protein n=1 Tax=Pseudoduganella namucuonensis TaxID=1035707 RepID=A0A1I7LIR9_9BURK|nr:DUF3426 domain-containing protein [Pseudoduganella namucuonensis]SFV09590.1 MJ0042 family finger-like domain-containing protein [Pseudoduganella namucuonensis]